MYKELYALPDTIVSIAGEKKIMLVLHEDELTVRFYEKGIELSSTSYMAFEEAASGNYFVDHVFPPISKQGLATAALKLFKESLDTKLIIQPYGSSRDLPSSVIPDAVPYFAKMIERGILEDNTDF